MKKYIFLYLIFLITIISCSEKEKELPNINGLWKVEKVVVDGFNRTEEYEVYLQLNDDGDFYSVGRNYEEQGRWKFNPKNNKMKFSAETEQRRVRNWFNNEWEFTKLKNRFMLKGRDVRTGITKLTFSKIDKIDFDHTLLNKIVGKWTVYKIKTNDLIKQLENNWIEFSDKNEFTFYKDNAVNDSGKIMVDDWNSEIVLDGDTKSKWKVSFVNDNIRLSNGEEDIVLYLKK